MCTAINMGGRFFGRTLDVERSYGEGLVLTPRERTKIGEASNRYAIIGMGILEKDVPMYFDGMNEWGLAAAALNFPEYAVYLSPKEDMSNIPSAHLITVILGLCRSVDEAEDMLKKVNITDEGAGTHSPTPLHWIISDQRRSITVEPLAEGLKIYDNPYGVLTNSPPFCYHTARLADFMQLGAGYPENKLTDKPLSPYSRGMGAIGLPGDFSSSSRFVRGVFVKENIRPLSDGQDKSSAEINGFFHTMSAVSVPYGCVLNRDGEAFYTRYTCLFDLETLTCYVTTYSNPNPRSVKLTNDMMILKKATMLNI